jgi:hypothetical protein
MVFCCLNRLPLCDTVRHRDQRSIESIEIKELVLVGALAPREKGLYGKSPEDAALIDQWMHLMESEVEFNTQHINYFFIGWLAPYSMPVRPRYDCTRFQ